MTAAQVGGWVPEVDEIAPPSTAPPASRSLAPVATGDLVVVVAAGGGVGRSVTADLVARQLCVGGPLILIDDAPGLVSSRRTLPRGDNGLAVVAGYEGDYKVLAPDTPTTRVDAVAAVETLGRQFATLI